VLAQLGDEGGGCLASPRLGISHGGGGAELTAAEAVVSSLCLVGRAKRNLPPSFVYLYYNNNNNNPLCLRLGEDLFH
jgi:hypothetical protein